MSRRRLAIAFSSGGVLSCIRPTAVVFLPDPRTSAPRVHSAASRWQARCCAAAGVSVNAPARSEGPEIRRILHEIRHRLGIEPKEHTETLIVKVFTTIVQKLGNRGNLGTVPTCLRTNQVGEAMNEIETAPLGGAAFQSSQTDSRCGHDRWEGPHSCHVRPKTTRSTPIPWGKRACSRAASTASILSRLLHTPK